MPRFGPSSNYSPSETAPPRRATPRPRAFEQGGESVCLSCLSPDGRSVHSLSHQQGRDATIESHSLPLQGTTSDEEANGREAPALVRTMLPQTIQSALAHDPPVELLCVDGEAPSSLRRDPDNLPEDASLSPAAKKKSLPLLCLYTRKSVFLLQLAYETNPTYDSHLALEGEVISVIEPFESYLLDALPSTDIVRIRPAPQRRMGYATICSPGAMAMLTSEHALVLYHGSRPKNHQEPLVTKPLTFGLEELADGEHMITDFVFCQSSELSLLSSISVLVLKASGAVLGASPVVFDGAVVSRSLVEESAHFLESEIDRLKDPNIAKWRQCKAALRLLDNTFGQAESSLQRKSHFVEARIQSGGSVQNATTWPIQLQGPLVIPSVSNPDETLPDALVMENIFSKGLLGMVIGRASHGVDFVVLPPSLLLPRFEFEDEEDRITLDDALFDSGVVVERVGLQPDDDETRGARGKPCLIQDPVDDSMVHFVTSNDVITISTNAMNVASKKVRLKVEGETGARTSGGFLSPTASEEAVKTTAWLSARVSPGGGSGRFSLVGAVVSGDIQLGHALFARLSNGSMDAINLTESRLLHESESFFKPRPQTNQPITREVAAANKALDAVNATPPLIDLINPLIRKVVDGISSMGKIVGGETFSRDITSVELAMAISVKERCENDVVLPLNQLSQITSRRMEALRTIHKNQQVQVENLKDMVQILKEKASSTAQKLREAESKAALLSERSSAVLEASQSIQPTITEAELDYFSFVKRLNDKCTEWEKKSEKLTESCTSFRNSMDQGISKCLVELSNEQVVNCNALLRGQAIILQRGGTELTETKAKIQELAAVAGLGYLEDSNTTDVQLYGNEQ